VGFETAKERAMKIEGVPAGYELVRIGGVRHMEQYLGAYGDILIWDKKEPSTFCGDVVLRKIQKPKTYRPFANAEEFEPHQLRFWRWKTDSESMRRPPQHYFENGWNSTTWKSAYDDAVFADGTPFGVEVSEDN